MSPVETTKPPPAACVLSEYVVKLSPGAGRGVTLHCLTLNCTALYEIALHQIYTYITKL